MTEVRCLGQSKYGIIRRSIQLPESWPREMAAIFTAQRHRFITPTGPAWHLIAVNDANATFYRLRPRLQAIAYSMLGSVADAEDVVQDVWLRWHGTDQARGVNVQSDGPGRGSSFTVWLPLAGDAAPAPPSS